MKGTLLLYVLLFVSSAFAQKAVERTNSMVAIGKSFLDTKYVAHTLDRNDEEQLVVNLEEVDCMTFVEYVLAKSLSSSFTDNLRRIRYRNGIIDGYTSRLHYASDWIDNGIRNGFLTDVTAENVSYRTELSVYYMSAHPELYKALAKAPENVRKMKHYEQALSGKIVSWLPKSELPDSGLPWIKEGDIIAVLTNIAGLDIVHVGIALLIDGKLHLLHASSTSGAVVISELSISRMLNHNKSWTGIRVIRMCQAVAFFF